MNTPDVPAASPAAVAVPVPAPAPQRPRCTYCGEPVGGDRIGVNWRRRLTDTELADHVTEVQATRDRALLLTDPQQPAPVFPPLPTADDTTITVYACADHAINIDAAALIHDGACTAPNAAGIDGCDCTPEPSPEPAGDPAPFRLPAHWQTGGAA